MAKVFYISGPAHRNRIGLTFAGADITAQSQPVLDGWGWADYWGCAEWQAWHQELLKVMSAQQAALTFTQAWNAQSSDANPYNWCKYNSTFRTYMKNNGVNVDSIASAIIMPVFDAAGNLLQGAGNVVTNTSNAADFLSSLIKPVAIVALVGLGYYGYKNYLKK